jgi:hypothetical protein
LPNKSGRRGFLKTLAAGAAVLIIAPLIGKAAALPSNSTDSKETQIGRRSSSQGSATPLVVVVRDNELIGYAGLNEIRITDSSMSSQLRSAFDEARTE